MKKKFKQSQEPKEALLVEEKEKGLRTLKVGMELLYHSSTTTYKTKVKEVTPRGALTDCNILLKSRYSRITKRASQVILTQAEVLIWGEEAEGIYLRYLLECKVKALAKKLQAFSSQDYDMEYIKRILEEGSIKFELK